MRSFSATNDPDREIGRLLAVRSGDAPRIRPVAGRFAASMSEPVAPVGRFAVFFSKTEPGLRFRSSYPAACSAGRRFDGARFGTTVSGNCRRVASLRRLCCGARACGSVSRRSGRRNRSLRRHRRRVRTTRWPAEPLGRVLSSFPFCDRNGVKIRFTNIR